jgi:cell division protease FtsH
MVTRWGLSDRLGPLSYGEEEGEVFLGHSVTRHKNVSDDTAHAIDEEIRAIIDRNYQRSEHILREDLSKLHLMAEALIKYETIDAAQIRDIMDGKPPQPPADWNEDDKPQAGAGSKKQESEGADSSEKPSDGVIGGPAGQH